MFTRRLASGLVALVAVGCQANPSQNVLRLDIVNRSAVAIVVSVVSDTAGLMQGFFPGDQGTMMVPLGTPDNGIGVEIMRAADCAYLVEGTQNFPTPAPFTLIVDGGPGAGSGLLSAEPEVESAVVPLPQNALRCPGG